MSPLPGALVTKASAVQADLPCLLGGDESQAISHQAPPEPPAVVMTGPPTTVPCSPPSCSNSTDVNVESHTFAPERAAITRVPIVKVCEGCTAVCTVNVRLLVRFGQFELLSPPAALMQEATSQA